jgi:hypothetical protein
MAVFHFVAGFYNPTRRHSALGCRAPIAYDARNMAVTIRPLPANRPRRPWNVCVESDGGIARRPAGVPIPEPRGVRGEDDGRPRR